ncbi:M1 family aminopeptidase [Sphingomonas abietis]|uniref:Aminopeptidase N n=1 Tax=Sphingomonas abietis TaxID=3012344 RepID=A0ABY7NR12_9SPHN|nr:M1 family aminopeptidase [Sphingomonas abietis]WBO22876.1 M1 family aminopeptidase [Sphingomonas abietis]
MRSFLIATGLAAVLAAVPAWAGIAPGDGFDVTRYRLALTPDIQNATVAGREIITLRATRDGVRQLRFSANALSIDAARLNGNSVTVTAQGDGLSFDLPAPLRAGHKVRLDLSYHGKPARGFARSGSALYTSYFACDWMVCVQNAFGDKAVFALALRINAGMDALSVGKRISRRAGPDGSEIQDWRAPRPYSSYLYGFAVGHFAHAEDHAGSARLSALSDVADAAELQRRFAETGEMVRFLEAKTGVALPVTRYTQLLVKGDEAQEAATYSVLGKDALPTTPGGPADDWAIIHELTHQWWGNLVTCATLRDFWLNEGITTFMTAAWKEHRYGRAAYDAELDVARARLDKARAKGFDKPLIWDGQYPSLGLRRAVQYSKGALFMDELRRTLGEQAFWAGLRRYTRTHAGGTVTSIDLERAMETASSRDLRTLFAQWVFAEVSNPAKRFSARGASPNPQ